MSLTHSSQPKVERQFPGQRDGEVVELMFRRHPLVMRKALVGGLLAILLAVIPLAALPPDLLYGGDGKIATYLIYAAIGVTAIVAICGFWSWMGWYYSMYLVTNLRIVVIKQRGLFARSVTEWQLDKILHVNYRVSGFQGVLFGYGDITVRTVIGDLLIPTVHKPVEIHEQLQDIVRRDVRPKPKFDAATPFYN